MLHVDDIWVDGAIDGVTLSTAIAGRPDADRSWDFPQITLNLTNVAPVTNEYPLGCIFVIQSSNAGCFWLSADFQLMPKPEVGATTLIGTRMSGQPHDCHIDAAKGDVATLLQLRSPVASDPKPHAFSARRLDLPGFVGPKNKLVIDGTMMDVPMHTFHGDLRASTFTAVVPSAKIGTTIVERVTAFSSLPLGYYPNSFDGPAADGPFDEDFPDPFPTARKQLYVHADGTGVIIRRSIDLTKAGSEPIALVLSPPTGLRINDAMPLEPVAHAGMTPTLHWSAPAHTPPGPLRYVVRIGKVRIWTMGTSLVIPSGVLEAGTNQAVVTAMWSPDPSDFRTHPLDGEFPETALAASGVFSE